MRKALFASLLSRSGCGSLLGKVLPGSGVLVLNYHRIGNGKGSPFDRGLWSTSAESLTDQIRFCKSRLEMITPDDLPRALAAGRGRYGIITFDDGYRDNYEVAFPILKAEGVPATFFITTGLIDTPKLPWWDEIAWMVRTSQRNRIELPGWIPAPLTFDEPDREEVVRALLRVYKAMLSESTVRYLDVIAEATGSGRYGGEAGKNLWMDWDMLREMKTAGMTIGGHTVSHQVLSRLTPEKQQEEIRGCADRLVAEMNEPMRYFSYPSGGLQRFDASSRVCLREANVQYAFSYYGGCNRFRDWDDYDIRRIAVEPCLTPEWFKSIVAFPRLFA